MLNTKIARLLFPLLLIAVLGAYHVSWRLPEGVHHQAQGRSAGFGTTIVGKGDNEEDNAAMPRILHFVYVTPGLPENQTEIPEAVKTVVNEWKDLHSNWKIVLWNNSLSRSEFPDIMPLLQRIPTPAWISDILRYHIIERFGGVYLDTDIVPFRSIEPLRQYASFTVCENPWSYEPSSNYTMDNSNKCKFFCNAVIADRPHNSALQHMIQNALKRTIATLKKASPKRPAKYATDITGPIAWTAVLRKYDFNIFKPFTFYPCIFSQTKNCRRENFEDETNVFAMHEWKHSWEGK